MRRAGVVLVAFFALAAGASAAARQDSGLFGVVTRGPVTPVCFAGRPCSAPVPNLTLAFSQYGIEVARATTDRRGAYRVALRGGTYTVRRVQRVGFLMRPTRVNVPAARWKRQDFDIDTGIR